MTPLPETFQIGAKAFWVRMEAQPVCELIMSPQLVETKEGVHLVYEDSVGNLFEEPYADGETLYLQEEWGIGAYFSDPMGASGLHPSGARYVLVGDFDEDGDYGRSSPTYYPDSDGYKEVQSCYLGYEEEWQRQPASTMPEWAARTRLTVTGVEPKQYPISFCTRRWGWYVTIEQCTKQ